MDKGKEYIKMCDCPEIQEQWEPVIGDNVLFKYGRGEYHGVAVGKTCAFKIVAFFDRLPHQVEREIGSFLKGSPSRDNLIWLPRQDQLQEMVRYEYRSFYFMVQNFFEKSHGDNMFFLFDSMEQLWLTLVMKEKFNKVWHSQLWKNDGH